MLGSQELIIDGEVFTRGMSSSSEATDGGFSPETDAMNPIAVPDVLYAPAAPTDASTNLTGQIIASCEDPTGTYGRLFVSSDGSQVGRHYSGSTSNVLTARGASDSGGTYVQGKTDMIAYKGEVYSTSSVYLNRWSSVGSSNTFNFTFFQFNDSTAPHPALVYEDNAFYGDGNLLRRQTSAGGTPSTILTLPTGSIIVALGIDAGSGKMLISYIGQGNLSATINTIAKVGFYDGFSNKLSRAVVVEEMITAFPNSEGVQYASYGQNLGYWNGSGVSFLRRFSAIAFDNTELLYKHHFATIGSTLYFIVDTQIIAHGHIRAGGPKVFYPAFKNNVNSNNLTHICSLGSGLLGISFTTSLFYTWSTISVATTNTMTFRTNMYRFPRPIQIRSAYIEWYDAVANNVGSSINLYFYNRAVIGNSDGFEIFSTLQNTTGSDVRELAADAVPKPSGTSTNATRGRAFRFRLNADTTNHGISRIIIYYDWVE